MTEKTGGPAFPCDSEWRDGKEVWPQSAGMSLRDWFAGQALAGYTASGDLNPYGVKSPESWAKVAACMYDIADAMIEERAKP